MPRRNTSAFFASALVCAALTAQPFDPAFARRAAAAAHPTRANPSASFAAGRTAATPVVQFGPGRPDDPLADYDVAEGGGKVTLRVERSGDLAGAFSVDYATSDGAARSTSDYTAALGTLRFAPSETSKTVDVFIVDDAYGAEGVETFALTLSNPTGGAQLGANASATVHVADNDSADGPNPVVWPGSFNGDFFVRQHYLDFLNREPDPPGFDFWRNELFNCGVNPACVEVRRINVSAAFFLSIEFQRTGMLAYLTHKAAFGPAAAGPDVAVPVLYRDFLRDTQALQSGYVFGAPGAEARLDANKQAFFDEFVTRPEFVDDYAAKNNLEFVDSLLANANLHPMFGTLYVFGLKGSEVVPPSGSSASGVFVLERDPDGASRDVTLSLSLKNLSSPVTAVHVHGPADPGAEAPVLLTLPAGPFHGVRMTLTPEQMSLLFNRKLYVDVHTEGRPGGELRGHAPPTLFRRDALFRALEEGVLTRAQALRVVAESAEFRDAEFRRAFVLMEYFGYLRRDPDAEGYAFWLGKLNQFNGDFVRAEMVKAFINSDEYRRRFGP